MCDLDHEKTCDEAEFECWDQEGLRTDWNSTECGDDVVDYCCKLYENCEQFGNELDYDKCPEMSYPSPTQAYFGDSLVHVFIVFDKDIIIDSPNNNCNNYFEYETVWKLGNGAICKYYDNIVQVQLATLTQLRKKDQMTFKEVIKAKHDLTILTTSASVIVEGPTNIKFNLNIFYDINDMIESCVDYKLDGYASQGTLQRWYNFSWAIQYADGGSVNT